MSKLVKFTAIAKTVLCAVVIFFVGSSQASAASANADCALYRVDLKAETSKSALPFDVAAAVMMIESSCNPHKVGGVGEIGLMQLRPATAAMLGFTGSLEQLAEPQTNIRLGVAYLAGAWRIANADLCRALMKYRAGHGEETMTPRSVAYCNRAREQMGLFGPPILTAAISMPAVTKEHALDRQSCLEAVRPLNIALRGSAFVANQLIHVKAMRRCLLLPPRWVVARR